MKKTLLVSCCIMALTSLLVFSCKTKKQAPATAVVTPSAPETKKLSYNTNIKSSIDYFCISCHTSAHPPKGIALETYALLKTAAVNKNFLGAVNHESGYAPMPPNLGGSKMPAETLADLKTWIESGMPE